MTLLEEQETASFKVLSALRKEDAFSTYEASKSNLAAIKPDMQN